MEQNKLKFIALQLVMNEARNQSIQIIAWTQYV